MIKRSLIIKLLILAVLLMATSVGITGTASAVDSSEFQAGRIIDDEVFYNKSAMGSAQAVHRFIQEHTPSNCDTWGTQNSGHNGMTNAQYAQQVMGWPGPPYVCLQNYHENPSTGETSFEKGGGAFTGGVSAGEIIWNSAQKYSINPQVLLVTLRKESLNLFSDSWPMKSQYKYAMGYGCPDSGPNYSANCASDKGGFYKQVELAAWQLRTYYNNMGSYNYTPGRWNTIQYNPQPSCGTKNVYIENYATASLYIYTPYTPNDASLQNYPGQASCGAYGNRNFWFMFNEWFGSTIITNAKIISKPFTASGWGSDVKDSGIIGTTGQNKALEAISIQGEVEYSTYNSGTGWQNTVNLGMVSGTIGNSQKIQGIKINLVGSLASRYDIYYRAHVSNIGWMSWTKNGLAAGATGFATNNIEALEVKLVLKGLTGPNLGSDSYRNNSATVPNNPVRVNLSAHVSNHGWQPVVTDGMIAGTIKQKRAVEAIKLNLTNTSPYSGNIVYAAHVAGSGWLNSVSSNGVAGTIKQSRQMEAIRITLTGQLSEHYDVWYRAQVQDFGWLGWAKNNSPAGTTGASKRLEAMEVRILPKNTTPLTGSTAFHNPKNKSIPSTFSLRYSSHAQDIGWLTSVTQNSISGTVKQSKRLEAIRIDTASSTLGSLDIRCSAYIEGAGWTAQEATDGAICGTTNQSKAIQAVKLTLTGDVANKYNLTYQVHVSNVGWIEWVTNGLETGTPSANQIEAIKINITEKN